MSPQGPTELPSTQNRPQNRPRRTADSKHLRKTALIPVRTQFVLANEDIMSYTQVTIDSLGVTRNNNNFIFVVF